MPINSDTIDGTYFTPKYDVKNHAFIVDTYEMLKQVIITYLKDSFIVRAEDDVAYQVQLDLAMTPSVKSTRMIDTDNYFWIYPHPGVPINRRELEHKIADHAHRYGMLLQPGTFIQKFDKQEESNENCFRTQFDTTPQFLIDHLPGFERFRMGNHYHSVVMGRAFCASAGIHDKCLKSNTYPRYEGVNYPWHAVCRCPPDKTPQDRAQSAADAKKKRDAVEGFRSRKAARMADKSDPFM